MTTAPAQPLDVDATRLAPERRSWRGGVLLHVALWLVTAGVVVAIAAAQVSPAAMENVVVAALWIGAASTSIWFASIGQIHRWLPGALVIATVAVVVAEVNPWHLAALDLALGHPEVLLAVAGIGLVITGVRVDSPGTPQRDGQRTLAVVLGLGILAGMFAVAVLWVLAFAPRDLLRSRDEVVGLRVDHHDVADQGLMKLQAVVLRSGSGLTMRERVVSRTEAVVEERDGVVEVCSSGQDVWTRIDPATLETLGVRFMPYCSSG